MPEPLVVDDYALADFRQLLTDGVGQDSAIGAPINAPIRIFVYLDVLDN